jgi:hypothetical protein
MFRDIKRRKVPGALPHQAKIWGEYCKPEFLGAADLALQLPTGSGKTLVGVCIAEWRRRRFKERVVYLCPTTQLVNQVVEQSNSKYGIRLNAFTDGRKKYSPTSKAEYANAEAVAVTTYSALFNTNSFFNNADIIILDDAHAAENYIAKFWSLLVERFNKKENHENLYKVLISALCQVITPEQYSRLISPDPDFRDYQWVEKVPTPYLYSKLKELIAIFDEHTKDNSLQYPWSVIRDHLFACQMYTSVSGILVRPVIPPTRTHEPFARAKQRIYMSATLGEGGELERIAGVEKVTRLTVDGWDKQGIGRRFFFFPETTLDQEAAIDLSIKMIQATDRALVLVPDDDSASEFKEKIKKQTGYKIFDATQIEKSKHPFISETNAVAVVANRYDGIDLSDDECRLLIVSGIQRATNLQEKFLVTRMPAGILFTDRIITRIVQAVGRCTRSDTDYAAVVVLGEELSNRYLLDKDRRPLLHPEIQAELEYGYQQSKDGYQQSKASEDEDNYIENLEIFLEHEDAWGAAEEDIIALRNDSQQAKLPGVEKLGNAVLHEVRYQYALWRRNFEQAFQECRAVITQLSGDDVQGYRAFWYYLAGSTAWIAAANGSATMESLARDNFKRASSTTEGVTWLFELTRLTQEENQENQVNEARLAAVIETLATRLSELGIVNDKKFEAEVKEIIQSLSRTSGSEADSKAFENGHEKLGRLLGYEAGNSSADAAPDPWWIAGDDFCIVFEDHSTEGHGNPLGANKVGQASRHPTWIKKNVPLRNNAEIIPVVVTPCETVSSGASSFTEGIGYWKQSEFIAWAEQAIAVIRGLRNQFSGEADLKWRKLAIQAYKDARIDPASLTETLRQQKLSSLPISG